MCKFLDIIISFLLQVIIQINIKIYICILHKLLLIKFL